MTDIIFEDYDSVEDWSKPIKVKGNTYIVKEADGYASEVYKNAAVSGASFNRETGAMTPGSVGSVENALVAACCFPCDENGNLVGDRLPVNVIRTWKAKIVTELFDLIKANSDLAEADDEDDVDSLLKQREEIDKKLKAYQEDQVGNSSSDTMHG